MRVQDYLVNRVLNTPVGVPLLNKRGWASVREWLFAEVSVNRALLAMRPWTPTTAAPIR
jgi:hypothetical protein